MSKAEPTRTHAEMGVPAQALRVCSVDSSSTPCTSSVCEQESASDELCWICLDGDTRANPLSRPCKCPRFSHAACLARWQLQSAGSSKEVQCEFCGSHLPDWRVCLTPDISCKMPATMNVTFDGIVYSFAVKPGKHGYQDFTERIRQAFHLPQGCELNITFTCDEPSTGVLHQSDLLMRHCTHCIVETAAGLHASVWADMREFAHKHACTSLHAHSRHACSYVSLCVCAGLPLTIHGQGAYDAAVHCAGISAARRKLASSEVSSVGDSDLPSPSHAPLKRNSLGEWSIRVRQAILHMFSR
mmetsp:Transcript_2518/g.6705  ORF Transcript_2518/g.6705 Transcript_2518/m.6705 type:complete len:300 (+) Transcript_2518:1592-2491(+)